MNEKVEGESGVTRYRAYLLTLWRSDSTPSSPLRASLEDAHTGERLGFACLEELFAFLMQVSGGIHGDSKD